MRADQLRLRTPGARPAAAAPGRSVASRSFRARRPDCGARQPSSGLPKRQSGCRRLCCTDQGAMFPTRSCVMRCGRNAGVQAPCGSGHGGRRLLWSPNGDPCASADHRRSPVCSARLQPRPWHAGSAYRRRPRYGGIDGSQATCPRDSAESCPSVPRRSGGSSPGAGANGAAEASSNRGAAGFAAGVLGRCDERSCHPSCPRSPRWTARPVELAPVRCACRRMMR